MPRVGDASAKLHPAAVITFMVLLCDTAMEQAEERLSRYGYEVDPDLVEDGWIGAQVERRAGYTHVTEALRDLFDSGAIRGR